MFVAGALLASLIPVMSLSLYHSEGYRSVTAFLTGVNELRMNLVRGIKQ